MLDPRQDVENQLIIEPSVVFVKCKHCGHMVAVKTKYVEAIAAAILAVGEHEGALVKTADE